MAHSAKKTLTPTIAATLAIAILFIGAIYFWSIEVRNIDDRERARSTATLNNADSDLSQLEGDLKSIDFSNIQ